MLKLPVLPFSYYSLKFQQRIILTPIFFSFVMVSLTKSVLSQNDLQFENNVPVKHVLLHKLAITFCR